MVLALIALLALNEERAGYVLNLRLLALLLCCVSKIQAIHVGVPMISIDRLHSLATIDNVNIMIQRPAFLRGGGGQCGFKHTFGNWRVAPIPDASERRYYAASANYGSFG